MARRRSLTTQLYQAYQKSKRAREQEQRRAARERAQYLRAMKAAEARREREAERAEQARLRQGVQAERELERRAAAARRERERQTAEWRAEEASRRTADVQERVTALNGLLARLPTGLAAWRKRVESAFDLDGSPGLERVAQKLLAESDYPEGVRGKAGARYLPEARELLIDYELPRQDLVPAASSYKYLKKSDEVQPIARKEADARALYGNLIARIALRTLGEAFGATPTTLVDSVVFNGYVSAKDRTTGKAIRPCLLSVNATRELVDDLVLEEPELDPVACLRGLNAIVSPHPYDLEPVRPVAQFDLSKYKFVKEMDVVAGLDSRPDLLDLTPVEFEHLIRRLLESMGMKSWVTQASRDDGVDAVAVNEDPVTGGLCVIQAKLWRKVIRLEGVHALAGVMNDKAAAKGILVTTSWFGKTSRDFVQRNGRMQLIDGRGLKALLLEHLDLDVLISLPTLPPGWQPRDVE